MTMMIRTNEVIISSRDGNSVSVVIKASNCNDKLYWVSLPEPLTFTMGIPCAQDSAGINKSRVIPAAHNSLAFKMVSFCRDWIFPVAQSCELVGAHTDQYQMVSDTQQGDFLSRSHANRF